MSTTNTLTDRPTRYHPLLIALHWLVAIVLFSAVMLKPEEDEGRNRFQGGNGGEAGEVGEGFLPPNFQPGNFPPAGDFTPRTQSVDIHMILGGVLLTLMVVRVITRFATKRPGWATTGNKLLDLVGELTHLGLYLLTFGILIAGGMMAYRDGLIASVLGLTTVSQGFSFGGFIFRALHNLSWFLLVPLLLLHIGGALYHQFLVKDNLMARMWFGKRRE